MDDLLYSSFWEAIWPEPYLYHRFVGVFLLWYSHARDYRGCICPVISPVSIYVIPSAPGDEGPFLFRRVKFWCSSCWVKGLTSDACSSCVNPALTCSLNYSNLLILSSVNQKSLSISCSSLFVEKFSVMFWNCRPAKVNPAADILALCSVLYRKGGTSWPPTLLQFSSAHVARMHL